MNIKKAVKFNLDHYHSNGKKKVLHKNEMKSQLAHQKITSQIQGRIDDNLRDISLENYLSAIKNNVSTEKYQPLLNYDYNVVILISSYNRFEMVSRLIDQFNKQRTRYKFKIILLNDGSTDVNYNVFKSYGEIDYHVSETNNGRNFYWYTVTQLWKYSKQYTSDTILMIDDDFILSENFLDNLLNVYYALKISNNNIVVIAPHLHATSKGSTHQAWWYNTYSVDGIGLFDRRFIETFNYQLEPVTSQQLASATHAYGWSQIHTKIINGNKIAYKFKNSIAFHDGNVSQLGKENPKKAMAYTQKLIEKDIKLSDLIYDTTMNKTESFMVSYYNGFKNIFPNLTEEEFKKYYEEAKYGGYPEEPGGSIWESEGKSIYVLIRILKPKNIIEIGNFLGRSSNHILQAVEANGSGDVTLLDIEERLEYDKLHNRNFKRILDDSLNFLATNDLSYDLYIQDGCHEYKHVTKELDLITSRTNNDFIIWAHDWFTVRPPQCEVKRAWDDHITKFKAHSPMIDLVSNCGCVIAEFKKPE